MEEYKQERKSVRKLFGLGIRRSMNKMGRALSTDRIHEMEAARKRLAASKTQALAAHTY